MKKKKIFLVIILFPSMIYAEVISNFPGGQINWDDGYILSENFSEAISEIYVDGNASLKEVAEIDEYVKKGLKKYKGPKILLYGENGLINLFLPEEEISENSVPYSSCAGCPLFSGCQFSTYSSSSNPASKLDSFTGLIIDASQFNFSPGLASRILTPVGIPLINRSQIKKEFIKKWGFIGYSRNLEEAKKNLRVGDNPLIVEAIGVKGKYNSDAVIDADKAEVIWSLPESRIFLEESKIIIVY